MRSTVILCLLLAACSPSSAQRHSVLPFTVTDAGHYNEPWAMAFLPDGRALITEKSGTLKMFEGNASKRMKDQTTVRGAPKVANEGQGGFGDIAISPTFSVDRLIYLSWVEDGTGGKGAVVGRARLEEDGKDARLENLTIIWRQTPKVSGSGHFGHRLAFGPDGKLYVSSGERQKFDPAQDPNSTLGKIMVMNNDGSDAKIWSWGHRNPLGLAFDAQGRLWNSEMGPRGGDELNLALKGKNYGYPKASNGSHYDGRDIPDHKVGDGFEAPKIWWNPSISPGSLMIYSGDMFAKWKGDAFIGALGGEALIRVDLDGERASKADEWPMGARIREVEQGPDGAIWILEDGEKGRLLKLTPKA